MGAFYNSLCIPRTPFQAVQEVLIPWFQARGFELSSEPVLFDLDGETERSVFALWNDDWTVLFYSHFEEERRWIRQLQALDRNLLYVWVHDSDVWGYDLFEQKGFAGSFNSDSEEYQPFSDEASREPERPVADPADVCRRLGLPNAVEELIRIQEKKAPFKEDICREFCRLIGAETALASYDDLENGNFQPLEGWNMKQLLFVHRASLSGMADVDVHSHKSMERHAIPNLASEVVNVPKDILQEMERRRRRALLTFQLLRPVFWMARAWRRLKQPVTWPSGGGKKSEDESAPRDRKLEGKIWTNERHQCRIVLDETASPVEVSSKPSAVFAFRVGDHHVTCTARHLWKIKEVLRQPTGSKVLEDRCSEISGLLTRHLLFELPPRFIAGSTDSSFLRLDVVQSPRALYVFFDRFSKARDEAVDRAILGTIQSFSVTDSA